MKNVLVSVAVVLGLMVFGSAAFAQEVANTVTVPYGDWAASVVQFLGGIASFVITGFILTKAGPLGGLIKMMKIDQLLEKAVQYGINKVSGAVAGKALTIEIGNEVLREAVDYAVKSAPASLIEWAGGVEMIREKIIARLNLDEFAVIK